MTQQKREKEIDWFFDTFNEELVNLERARELYKHCQHQDKREAYKEAKNTFIQNALNHPRFKKLVKNYAEARKSGYFHPEDKEAQKQISVTKNGLNGYIGVFSEILADFCF